MSLVSSGESNVSEVNNELRLIDWNQTPFQVESLLLVSNHACSHTVYYRRYV